MCKVFFDAPTHTKYDAWEDEDENNLCGAEEQLDDGQGQGWHLVVAATMKGSN